MRPEVILEIPCDNCDGSTYLEFNTLEEVDSVVETLFALREKLKNQIEEEKNRKRERRKRAKARKKNKSNEKELMNIPIKLKNGNEFSVTCDDVVFDPKDGIFHYLLDGKIVLSVNMNYMQEEEEFEG